MRGADETSLPIDSLNVNDAADRRTTVIGVKQHARFAHDRYWLDNPLLLLVLHSEPEKNVSKFMSETSSNINRFSQSFTSTLDQ